MQTQGLESYLYEYVFARAIETTKEAQGRPLMVSMVKGLRLKVDERLGPQYPQGLATPGLGVTTALTAIEETLSEGIDGYEPVYPARTGQDSTYQNVLTDFMDMTGMARGDRQPVPGPMGVRLPISPYDPRYTMRSGVMDNGSSLTYVSDEDIELALDGDVTRLASSRMPGIKLRVPTRDESKLREHSDFFTREDAAGLSALRTRMSAEEYANVRDWVLEGAMTRTGYDSRLHMSPEALGRATAIMDDLRESGIGYTVSQDRNPGQIKLSIEGTRIQVRLTETRDNERYVGKVYDWGVNFSYSTTERAPGSHQAMEYTPSAKECVDLVRLAMGQEVLDDQGRVIGAPRTIQGRKGYLNTAYHTNEVTSFTVRELENGESIKIRKSQRFRSARTKYFRDDEHALNYLRDAVSNARSNMETMLDIDRLINEAEENREQIADGDYMPVFHGDPSIAAIQRSYWDVLTGARRDLLRPGASEEAYYEKLGVIGELAVNDDGAKAAYDSLMSDLAYVGPPAEQVRMHAEDVIDTMIGTFEPHTFADPQTGELREQRFNPTNVAKYMISEGGLWTNNTDMVTALRRTQIDPDELMGETSQTTALKNRLIAFNDESSRNVLDLARSEDDSFIARMSRRTLRAIERNACVVDSMEIDDQGIIRYTGRRVDAMEYSAEKMTPVTGYVGQIFEPGEYGEVITKFGGGENYMFVPGYEARIVAQKPGENLSVEERTRLRGYEQILAEQIDYQVAQDMLVRDRGEIGAPTNLNAAYRRSYDTRHAVDFIERSREEGLSDELRNDILATEARRVRYSNSISKGSTVSAAFRAKQSMQQDPSNDVAGDIYNLTGQRNMAIMTRDGDGFFDPEATSDGVNQGIVRYLVESAQVTPDGQIIRGDLDDRTPLMKNPVMSNSEFNPYDRNRMTFGNLMRAASVSEPVGAAMTTIQGLNFDDGMVISKRFAETYMIRGANGEMRPLMVGDKISDLHGNKGVIPAIIDPDMDPAEAERLGLTHAVTMFRDNPDLDVVMSPFSFVSRFNAGLAREMMDDTTTLRLQSLGREDAEGGIGHARFLVTSMAVDKKTKIYDEEATAQGKGRRAGSQGAWAFQSFDAPKTMNAMYSGNSAGVANVREFCIVTGLDMEADGTLREGFEPHDENDVRRLIEMPALERSDSGRVRIAKMKADFGALIGDKGGDLELPFPLTFPGVEGEPGDTIPTATDSTWRLPVLSSHLRAGQELEDGSNSLHDYTHGYMTIFANSLTYRDMQERLATGELSPDAVAKAETVKAEAVRKAQMAFDGITSDISRRRFAGKRNIWKESVMSVRLPDSATAVWTPQPHLAIDQVAMSSVMAEALGLDTSQDEDAYVHVWRDPVWRDAGVRYMRVKIDDSLTGVAINPVMDKSFDGDFDGDTVAVAHIRGEGVHEEGLAKMSVQANLLDLSTKIVPESEEEKALIREYGLDPERGYYPFMIQDTLDVKVAHHDDPALKSEYMDLLMEANAIHLDYVDGHLDDATAYELSSDLTGRISEHYSRSLFEQAATATISFKDMSSFMDTVNHVCVETGAKGSPAKLADLAVFAGVEQTETGTWVDHGRTLATRERQEGVQLATAIKSHGTGFAGSFAQRAVRELRNVNIKAVLEATYGPSQGILQSKHSPVEAEMRFNAISSARELWRGRLLERGDVNGMPVWDVVYEDGKSVQADPETWKRQFMEIYTDKQALNVNINPAYVETIAEALTGPDGLIYGVEPDDAGLSKAAPMDKMAYGGDFAVLKQMARERKNLFEGRLNQGFAPYVIKANMKAMDEYDRALDKAREGELVADPKVRSIVAKDSQATNLGRFARRRSPLAAAAGRSDLGRSPFGEGGRPTPAPASEPVVAPAAPVIEQSATTAPAPTDPMLAAAASQSRAQVSTPAVADPMLAAAASMTRVEQPVARAAAAEPAATSIDPMLAAAQAVEASGRGTAVRPSMTETRPQQTATQAAVAAAARQAAARRAALVDPFLQAANKSAEHGGFEPSM